MVILLTDEVPVGQRKAEMCSKTERIVQGLEVKIIFSIKIERERVHRKKEMEMQLWSNGGCGSSNL